MSSGRCAPPNKTRQQCPSCGSHSVCDANSQTAVHLIGHALICTMRHCWRRRCALQLTEREAVELQTQLLAFDRQNHMGASDSLAKSLRKAIKEEAEAMLSEKKVVSGAVNIQENADKMKVPCQSIHPSPAVMHSSALAICAPQTYPVAIP